jgi:hypothetical protein
MLRVIVTTACCAIVTSVAVAQSRYENWLDRPLTNWNDSASAVPRAEPMDDESVADVAKRCTVPARRDTVAERALADAGWLPYLHVDRQIVQRDVEIVGGMAGADGMCRPIDFNVFVFVGGTFAGTLSPLPMASRADGAIGAVRVAPDDTITADFARYQDSDALCCPSSRVSVRYRVDRTGKRPLVVPMSVQRLR